MKKNTEKRLHIKNLIHYFKENRLTAGALAAGLICVFLLSIAFLTRYPSASEGLRSFLSGGKKSTNMPYAVKGGPPPVYLRWDINLNLKDDACLPGEEIKLDINLTGVEEDVKIIDVIPSIIITRIGTTEREELIENIPLPQLKDTDIKKGETSSVSLKLKAPKEPGVYIIVFGEMKLQHKEGTVGLSGGGTRFTVLAPKSEVHIKNINANKEINAHGNIIRIKDITMNEKETKINYTISYAQRHALCSFKLNTDSGETLYEIGWMGRDIQGGMEAWVSFNPVPLAANKLMLEVSNLNETSSEGVKYIDGIWEVELPIN